ncbi:MAG: nucleotidyltransferase family protein [Gemmataceae bacterium]|nr:nucleotidyltransferase family protein [Gemmataceae bacterium]
MQERGVIAAVLAGGLGTRLRSALPDRPKVLAPVHDRPYLHHLLRWLHDAGLTECVLLVGHRADQVRAAMGARACGVELSYSEEASPLGTGGAVTNAVRLIASRRLLLLNGDSHCGLDLKAFIRRHEASGAKASMALARVAEPGRYGQVTLIGDRVWRFVEKGPSHGPGLVNAGVYLLEPEAVQALPSGPSSLERDLFPVMSREGNLAGCPTDGPFLDIGTPESYAQAEAHFAAFAAG